MLTRQTLYIGDSRRLDSGVSSSSDYTYYFLHAHSNVINFERNLWQYLYKNSFKINLLVKPKTVTVTMPLTMKFVVGISPSPPLQKTRDSRELDRQATLHEDELNRKCFCSL